MSQGESDRNLLFGVLALQMDFITREALIAAMHAWVLEKGKPLGRILVERRDLDEQDFALLEPLVAKHVERHGGDPERSLASLTSVSWLRQELLGVVDPELSATVARMGAAPDGTVDPDQTSIPSVGEPSLAGQRFRILRPHASGGLGEVYVARDGELNREVALKQIKGGYADHPESRSRFMLEAEVTGGLEHPGVVPVYGLGHYPDGRPFYAMRFIRGDSLKQAIEQFHRADSQPGRDPGERALALRQLLRRFVDVCNTIAYAHSRGVLHRDLKPGNVMLGPYGETLVVDWGLAKPIGRPEGVVLMTEGTLRPSSQSGLTPTQMGSAVGTPAFMSPEQAAGRLDELGSTSDVYSLGAMLYTLLTGRAPFTDGDLGAVLRKVEAGEFPPPRQVNRAAPPALEAVCLKAMAREPASRYPSPAALADDIELWLADEPVAAWREPLSVRARRWARRHRTAMIGATAAVLAGLIGLAAVAAVQARSNRALKKANGEKSRALDAEKTAKKDTENALAQSEEARKRAEAVLKFLKDDVLAATRPEGQDGGLGKEVSVRKAIDAAEPKIALAFKDQPIAEADVRATLAMTYFYLSETPLAIRQFERAVELRRARLGIDHPDLLRANGELAVAYLAAGHTTEAIKLFEATLGSGAANLGPDNLETLVIRANLAKAYRVAGRTAEAIRVLEETSKLIEAKHGPYDRNTLTARNNLAVAYHQAGRTAEAIALHESTLSLQESKLGPEHPDTLGSRNNLAATYYAAGRKSDAVRLLEVTLKLATLKLGPEHGQTLTARNNLAEAYRAVGRTDEAIALNEETLRLRELKLGPGHRDTIASRNNLAVAYARVGRTAEAIVLHQTTVKQCEIALGTNHPHTLISRNNLGNTYRAAGRFGEAVELLEATLGLQQSTVGPDHPDTLITRDNLASAYEAAGRMADAEPLRRDAVTRRRAVEKPDRTLLAGDLAQLADVLLKQAKWSEAEPVLRETLAIRDRTTPTDWTRFDTMSQLGGALLGQHRFAEAESLVIDGYNGIKTREFAIPAPAKPRLKDAAERVIQLYTAWGNSAKAAEWKTKLGLADLPGNVFARP